MYQYCQIHVTQGNPYVNFDKSNLNKIQQHYGASQGQHKAIIGLGSDKKQKEMTTAFLKSGLCNFFVTYRPQIEAEISNSSCFWLQSDLSRSAPFSFLCNMDKDNDRDNVRIQSPILAVFGLIMT